MKVRIKFTKTGPVKFIGHLDTMRYFQKAVRRSELPAAFSGGYSPHMIMSFAAPLGVGMESLAEYFDMELTEEIPCDEIVERLNREMADGFSVIQTAVAAEGKAGNAMALVAAADYLITFREGKAPAGAWLEKLPEFLNQPVIETEKETKKGVRLIDIRPFIYEMKELDGGIFVRLASASSNYTRPDTVMKAFYAFLGEEMPEYAFQTRRLEVYADQGTEEAPRFVTLLTAGEQK